MRRTVKIAFWLPLALIAWTQIGYAAVLAVVDRLKRTGRGRAGTPEHGHADPARRSAAEPPPKKSLPPVSLIVAAHDEQASIAAKVANALALDYPRELLQVIVACDGCADATAELAREAGADLVLELPRGGKIRAQDAAVARAAGELVAFSDANALWEPDALALLVAAFDDPGVGYACGQARFGELEAPGAVGWPDSPDPSRAGPPEPGGVAEATNQEGLYWRYELAVRGLESRLSSVTAGNGAIYATRRESYMVVDPIMGHDLSFPFRMVKNGWRAVYVPEARSLEPMVPSVEGEFARKRRMMAHTWPILLRGGMLSPRGYPPGYAVMILSHRLLRYATPFLHLLALAANVGLVAGAPAVRTGRREGCRIAGRGEGAARRDGPRRGPGRLYRAALGAQLALLAAAGLGGVARRRALLVARYYVLTTASLALGLWDWLRHGTDAGWEAAEGTRPATHETPGTSGRPRHTIDLASTSPISDNHSDSLAP